MTTLLLRVFNFLVSIFFGLKENEETLFSKPISLSVKIRWYVSHVGNNFVSDGHVCNTFCPVLQKLVDVGLKTF